MRKLLLSIVVLCGLHATAVADQLTAPSFWKNQRGSELRITALGANGAVRGTFTNYAPNYQCKGIPYAVSGRTTAVLTTLRVNFVRCKTVTTWQGAVQGLAFPTTWTLQYNGQTETGFDFFYRIN
jgi:hypothetical protein